MPTDGRKRLRLASSSNRTEAKDFQDGSCKHAEEQPVNEEIATGGSEVPEVQLPARRGCLIINTGGFIPKSEIDAIATDLFNAFKARSESSLSAESSWPISRLRGGERNTSTSSLSRRELPAEKKGQVGDSVLSSSQAGRRACDAETFRHLTATGQGIPMKGLKEMDAVAAAAALSELARLPGAQRCHREAAEPAPDGSGPAAREDPGDAATEPMPSNGDVCMEVVTDSPLPLAGVARPDGHGWGDSPLGSEGGGAFPAEFAFYGSRTKSAISGSGGDSPSASASPMLLPSKSRSRAPAHVPRQPKGSGGCEATLKALESDEGVGDQEAPVIPNEDRAKGKTPQSAPQATKPSRSSGQQQTGAGKKRSSSRGPWLSQPKQAGQRSLSEMGFLRPSQAHDDVAAPAPVQLIIQRCPMCNMAFPKGSMNSVINSHIDECLRHVAMDDDW